MESTDGHTFKASMVNSESAGKVLYVCHAWLGNALGYPRMNWKVLLRGGEGLLEYLGSCTSPVT